MMSRRVLDSARFLRLPAASRELYFQMLLRADDDGVLEVWPLLRLLGADDADLTRLEQGGFVRVLNEDLVCYLPDWREHNTIRADRKVDSIYRPLLEEMVPDVELVEPRPRGDATGGGETPDCPSSVHGPLRIGKDRVGQDRTDEGMEDEDSPEEARETQSKKGEARQPDAAGHRDGTAPAPEERRMFGRYGNVALSLAEYTALKTEFPSDWRARIERLDSYIETKGTHYRNHLALLRRWAEEDAAKSPPGGGKGGSLGGGSKINTGVDPMALAAIRRRLGCCDAPDNG